MILWLDWLCCRKDTRQIPLMVGSEKLRPYECDSGKAKRMDK